MRPASLTRCLVLVALAAGGASRAAADRATLLDPDGVDVASHRPVVLDVRAGGDGWLQALDELGARGEAALGDTANLLASGGGTFMSEWMPGLGNPEVDRSSVTVISNDFVPSTWAERAERLLAAINDVGEPFGDILEPIGDVVESPGGMTEPGGMADPGGAIFLPVRDDEPGRSAPADDAAPDR